MRPRPPWHFDATSARRELTRFFGTRDLSGFGAYVQRHIPHAAKQGVLVLNRRTHGFDQAAVIGRVTDDTGARLKVRRG